MTFSSSSNTNTNLYLFTTSQIPLPIKYPHPRKPILVLPSLIHRSLHNSLDGETPSFLIQQQEGSNTKGKETIIIPHPDNLIKHDLPPLQTSTSTSTISGSNDEIEKEDKKNEHPSKPTETQVNGEIDGIGLSDSSANYLIDSELTVKLHLIGGDDDHSSTSTGIENDDSAKYLEWIKESLNVLTKYKGLNGKQIDNFLIGFKGLDYRGSKTKASEMFGCGSEGLEAPNTESISDTVLEKSILNTFSHLIQDQNDSNSIIINEKTKLGSLYSTLDLLKQLVSLKQNNPNKGIKVNALDTPDCHHLPKEYTNYAKENGIELWAGGGGEGSDPLPSNHLHNLLQEFSSKISDLTNEKINSLQNQIPLREDGLKFDSEKVKSSVDVKWVLSYTLVSKTRNVVKDKGYIVSANFTA
ncbi:uncharacterized protein L201_003107 [Kwoniella dendrophila CBS 6074]|uniref:Uncharacterized protein n=1 Tax=Kwoniella dendrophila CBS 6074 TaxID=1295534 RepID=A0AAX4JS23_9TREE